MSAAELGQRSGPELRLLLPDRAGPAADGDTLLLGDDRFAHLVRWVFTARLVCLALAAPAAFTGPRATAAAALTLALLTVSSLVFSRSTKLVGALLRHPLLASLDVAITVGLLASTAADQPGALTAVCSALVAGLLFQRRVLLVLMVPLAIGALGVSSPGATTPQGWISWLAVVAGLPALVIGVSIIGAVMRRNVTALIAARLQVAEAVAAASAADERARLARDMHDSVGKSLHGISLGAKALRRAVGRQPDLAAELAESLAQSADHAAGEARTLLTRLRSGQDDRPTIEVIREVVDRWSAGTGVPVALRALGAVDAAPEVTAQLQPALGEMLHNIAKHAGASRVEVTLSGDPETITLTVTDDGVGFEPAASRRREAAGHYGLRGLAERAEQVDGTATVASEPGKGTTITWTARRQPLSR